MEVFKLGENILALLEMVLGFWNNQISLVFSLLGQSPVSFKGGGPWAVVENLQPLFVGVGSGLVVLFFVVGFCAESVDIKSEFRLEAMLRMLIRLGIAQWLVANNLTILKAFFSSIGAMVSHIGNTTMAQASIGAGEAEVIENLGFATSLVFLILSVILSLIILVCGFFIIYTVYFRFLKIMVIVPLAAIAFSTLAGNRAVSATCVRYFKYFLSVVMEAVTMALAIIICNAFISAGLPSFTGGYADWAQVLIYLCEITFTIALTVGACKGAQSLTGRALGL